MTARRTHDGADLQSVSKGIEHNLARITYPRQRGLLI